MSCSIFLNCDNCVAVEGLKNHLAEERIAHGLRQRRGLLDQRRVETFQDVRICLERHDEEFLQFPVAALPGVVLELFRCAEERPLQVVCWMLMIPLRLRQFRAPDLEGERTVLGSAARWPDLLSAIVCSAEPERDRIKQCGYLNSRFRAPKSISCM